MIRNQAGQVVTAQLNALADGTPVTSGTTDILVVKDGIGASGAGLIVHTGDGLWSYFPTQDETDAAHLAFVFNNVLAGTQTPQLYTESVHAGIDTPCGNVPITTVIEDFKTRFPQFDPVMVDQLLPFLIEEYCKFYNKPYTSCTKAAILYLMAHMYVLELRSSSGNYDPSRTIASKGFDAESVSYEGSINETEMQVFYNSTIYGQKFREIIKPCQGGYFV